jgi:16S rRNA (cytosine1402-N4)-methyltransferase
MTATAQTPHLPVLLTEVVDALAPAAGERHVDGTFGAGGYTMALLDRAPCRVIAIDRDPDAAARGRALAAARDGRLEMIEGRFGDMDRLLAERGIERVDGVTLDIGVSSMQIDDGARGFSFAKDGPLDMRMGQSGPTAADLVNSLEEGQLADIIFRYGEERLARRIARAIVAARRDRPFTATGQLAELVRRTVPRSKDGIDPATRTFQALRIAVNDELGELSRGLAAAERLLAPGGRLAVVSFHSLEDRMVKAFLKDRSGQAPRPSRHMPGVPSLRLPSFALTTRKPITPGESEIAANPRARSARLRTAIRTDAPAWPAAAAALSTPAGDGP